MMTANPQWGAGPWDHEPNSIDWDDESTGLHCYALRSPAGAWAGYVAVPRTHPWHGVDFGVLSDVDAHGGLTFSGERFASAHPGMHWIGFDCAHGWDRLPAIAITHDRGYRDLRYVMQQCAQLARQVKEAQR